MPMNDVQTFCIVADTWNTMRFCKGAQSKGHGSHKRVISLGSTLRKVFCCWHDMGFPVAVLAPYSLWR